MPVHLFHTCIFWCPPLALTHSGYWGHLASYFQEYMRGHCIGMLLMLKSTNTNISSLSLCSCSFAIPLATSVRMISCSAWHYFLLIGRPGLPMPLQTSATTDLGFKLSCQHKRPKEIPMWLGRIRLVHSVWSVPTQAELHAAALSSAGKEGGLT